MHIRLRKILLRLSLVMSFLFALNNCGRSNDTTDDKTQSHQTLLGSWKNITLPVENNGSGIEVGKNIAGVSKEITLILSQDLLTIKQTCTFDNGHQIHSTAHAAMQIRKDYLKILDSMHTSTRHNLGNSLYDCFIKIEPKLIAFRLQEFYELDGKAHPLDEPTLELASFASFKKIDA